MNDLLLWYVCFGLVAFFACAYLSFEVEGETVGTATAVGVVAFFIWPAIVVYVGVRGLWDMR